MTDRRDPLDAALDALPRDVVPRRDLWNAIHAEIGAAPVVAARAPEAHRSRQWMRLAAGFVLIVASSLTTYVITRQASQDEVLQARREQMHQAVVPAMPVSFGPQALGEDYQRARKALDAEFQRQIATLPPVTRARLERNLADLRRAANEVSATLADHPNHPLLQELLMSTYQSELALLGSVSDMNVAAPVAANETRL